MSDKQKLHKMIDDISDTGALAYLATFIELWLEKWGGRCRK